MISLYIKRKPTNKQINYVFRALRTIQADFEILNDSVKNVLMNVLNDSMKPYI